jgi:hypothetical protein
VDGAWPVTEKCGRLTKAGTPCKITRAATAGWYTALRAEAPACLIHLTRDERAVYIPAAEAVKADEERRMLAYHQSLPVACWNWPVSDNDRRRAQEARDCTDPERARSIAWKLLADWQDDRCAVCGRRSDFLDHDHKTGLVRGWLCHSCNTAEGSPAYIPGDWFERYREKNPATILGIEIRYLSPFTGWAEPDPGPVPLEQHPAYVLAEYLRA